MFKLKQYLAANLAFSLFVLVCSLEQGKAQNISPNTVAKRDTSSKRNDASSSDADINLGYRFARKSTLLNAVSSIPGTNINELATVSLSSLLQGQASGVQVVNSSGAAGAGALINMRGISTLNAGTTPLFILDGIPVKSTRIGYAIGRNSDHDPLTDINPGDIASVTFLKDAHATALYGMRGSNGVVLIDTYGGTTGKTVLDVTALTGVMNAPDEMAVFDAGQYRSFILEKERARGLTETQISDGIGKYLLISTPDNQKARYNNNTNWQDMMYQGGLYNDYHFNLRGGDAVTRYSVNTGFTNQKGAIVGTDFSRFTTRFNLDYKVGRKLSFINSLAYSQTQKNISDAGNAYLTNPVFLSEVKSPTLGIYRPAFDGSLTTDLDSADYAGRSNLYSVINRMTNTAGTNRIAGRIIAQYDFSRYLNLRVGISADFYRLTEKRFRPGAGFAMDENIMREAATQNSIELMGLNENILSYNRSFGDGKHTVSGIVGTSVQSTQLDSKAGVYINSPSDQLITATTGDIKLIDSLAGRTPKWNLLSGFVSGNYVYNDKYLVGATLRADGSSRFAKGHRWGYFPSVALGWVISEESFLRDVKMISQLKLRTSYGITGNEDVGVSNAYNAATPAGYFRYPGVKFGSLGDKNFTWEKTAQFNAGFDLTLFNNRVSLTSDFYIKNTTNLYNRIDLPGISGFKSYPTNGGKIENKGVEATLALVVLNGKLKWQTGFNGSYNKNRILSLPDGISPITSYGSITGITQIGSAVGVFYGYKATGVYQYSSDVTLKNGLANTNPFKGGDIIFTDINSDGIIDEKDRTVIGKSTPDFFGGFTNALSYKRFDLNVFMDFSVGNDIYNGERAALEAMSNYDNQSISIEARWKNEGDQTTIPRLLHGDAVGNNRFSSRWIEDGSYLRFRSVSLGYTIPTNKFVVKGRVKGKTTTKDKEIFKSARVYITGQNLYTFTSYKGQSPDVANLASPLMYGQSYGHIPQLRSFLLGIKLGL